jgi:hypothetical protein
LRTPGLATDDEQKLRPLLERAGQGDGAAMFALYEHYKTPGGPTFAAALRATTR